jgi:uncharacterized membrane protein
MSAAHAHLLLNHIPILGTLFGLLLLLYALVRGNDDIKKASFGVFVITSLITIPAFLSGLGAAAIVHDLTSGSEIIIEQHRQAALIMLVAVVLLGVVALLSLWLSRHSPNIRGWIVAAALALAVISAGLGMWAGNLGGQVRHTEVRAGFSK